MRRRTSRPAASPSVQKRRALASLMMTTGWVSGRSASLKLAEDLIACRLEEPGSTSARSAMKAPWSVGGSHYQVAVTANEAGD